MADITITIPNPVVNRVLDAFAAHFGWIDEATSGTKVAFAKDQLRIWVKDIVKQEEAAAAQRAAYQATIDDIDTNIIIT